MEGKWYIWRSFPLHKFYEEKIEEKEKFFTEQKKMRKGKSFLLNEKIENLMNSEYLFQRVARGAPSAGRVGITQNNRNA